MWQENQTELLASELDAIVAYLPDIAGLRELVREPLTVARRALAAQASSDRPWPLLPLMVSEAICGQCEHVLPAAAAIQLLMAAGDVFDDVEDADSSVSLAVKHGSALATNAATTLLILAESAITRLKAKGIDDGRIVRVFRDVNSYYVTACAGQHMELSLTGDIAISEEAYVDIISMKSAAQVECACHVGAMLATDDSELVAAFDGFGHELGMAAQIANDIAGITRPGYVEKNKMTLPIVYALSLANDDARNQLGAALRKPCVSDADSGVIRDLLFRTGAMHYATVRMEMHRQRAVDALARMSPAGVSVERLRLLLE